MTLPGWFQAFLIIYKPFSSKLELELKGVHERLFGVPLLILIKFQAN